MKIHTLENWEYWYDRSVGVWYASEADAEGNLIGETLNACAKEDILLYINREIYGRNAELLERLQDRDISRVAKASIVEELKNNDAEVLKCVFTGKKPEGFRNDFELDETYVVLRKTAKSVWVWSGVISKRFSLNGDGEYQETGWTNDIYRTVLVQETKA